MPYASIKGFSEPKIRKTDEQKFLTGEEVGRLLGAVEREKKKKWKRDHCAIFLGYFLGLRCSEACILERNTFRGLDHQQVFIRTMKNMPRVSTSCGGCGRRWSVSVVRVGKPVNCPRCGVEVTVPTPRRAVDLNPPEKSPPVVETKVLEYVRTYLQEMRPDQRWLLESTPGEHISVPHMHRVFNYYVLAAQLDPAYSFHALRHGRGVRIYEKFEDFVMVRDMLRQKSISSTEWYMHLSPQRKQKLRDALDTE